eukprot:scaffold1219_cov400-Prasinococcus_capsulatus_cf.AAC.18
MRRGPCSPRRGPGLRADRPPLVRALPDVHHPDGCCAGLHRHLVTYWRASAASSQASRWGWHSAPRGSGSDRPLRSFSTGPLRRDPAARRSFFVLSPPQCGYRGTHSARARSIRVRDGLVPRREPLSRRWKHAVMMGSIRSVGHTSASGHLLRENPCRVTAACWRQPRVSWRGRTSATLLRCRRVSDLR